MRNVFLTLFILLCFSQCTEECETCGQGRIMENYVLKYYTFSEYSNIFVNIIEEDSAGICFDLQFYNGEIVNCILPKNEDMLVKFREIAKYNGDTAYYRPISTCFPYTCLSDKTGRFDIYCDREYAGYPAETLLNDLVTIRFYSAEEFVRSDYVNAPVKQYSMPLTEFNAGNYYLIVSNHISFVLNVKPDYPAEYRFTFTYSDNLVKFSDPVFTTFD